MVTGRMVTGRMGTGPYRAWINSARLPQEGGDPYSSFDVASIVPTDMCL